ncbi:MAG: hypothetical protein Q8O94_04410 [bacterium]|nr:hypothetical protein [bacterium]
MKKILLASIFFLFLGFASHALAQGFVPLAPIPGLTQDATADPAGLATFFNNLYKYLIGIAAVLAVIMIIWGGLEISTQDSISKQGAGKEKITNAIYGLILVLSPVLVFSIINPSILNLSLNLPELKTSTTATQPTTGTTMTSQYIACADSTCSDALKSCSKGSSSANASSPTVVCLKPDGTVDPNGRTDRWYNTNYVCVYGESPAVYCTQFANTANGSTVLPGTNCTPNNGTYLVIMTCVNTKGGAGLVQGAAACPKGLKGVIPTCSGTACKTVYCEKSITVIYYAPATGIGTFDPSKGNIIPSNEQTQTEFTSGCSADGGKVSRKAGSGTPCPSDSGLSIGSNLTNASNTTIVCYNETLTCQPK